MASLVSDQLKFSESVITNAEHDSTLPNPMEFMQVLVGCDSDINSSLETRQRERQPTLQHGFSSSANMRNSEILKCNTLPN